MSPSCHTLAFLEAERLKSLHRRVGEKLHAHNFSMKEVDGELLCLEGTLALTRITCAYGARSVVIGPCRGIGALRQRLGARGETQILGHCGRGA